MRKKSASSLRLSDQLILVFIVKHVFSSACSNPVDREAHCICLRNREEEIRTTQLQCSSVAAAELLNTSECSAVVPSCHPSFDWSSVTLGGQSVVLAQGGQRGWLASKVSLGGVQHCSCFITDSYGNLCLCFVSRSRTEKPKRSSPLAHTRLKWSNVCRRLGVTISLLTWLGACVAFM